MENPESSHSVDIRKSYWDAQTPMLERLSQGVSDYLLSIADIERAFQGENKKAACIDDRLSGNLRLAGLGILLPREKAVAILRQMAPDGLRWHALCGAAAEAYRRLTPENQARYTSPDKYAEAFANDIAQELGLPPAQESEVDPDFHVARALYYDGTGKFDPSMLKESLPPGFLISRKYMDEELSKETVEFSLRIAIGDHGFGEKIGSAASNAAEAGFGPGQEMLFIAIGADSHDLEKLKQELEEVALRYPGKVKVDGFIAPH